MGLYVQLRLLVFKLHRSKSCVGVSCRMQVQLWQHGNQLRMEISISFGLRGSKGPNSNTGDLCSGLHLSLP